MLKYKGYRGGAIELDEAQYLMSGRVLGIQDVVTFSGKTAKELVKAFHDSVDDYLEFCTKRGESPDRPYSGKLMLRMPPELHRRLSLQAQSAKRSLNTWIVRRLKRVTKQTVE